MNAQCADRGFAESELSVNLDFPQPDSLAPSPSSVMNKMIGPQGAASAK